MCCMVTGPVCCFAQVLLETQLRRVATNPRLQVCTVGLVASPVRGPPARLADCAIDRQSLTSIPTVVLTSIPAVVPRTIVRILSTHFPK